MGDGEPPSVAELIADADEARKSLKGYDRKYPESLLSDGSLVVPVGHFAGPMYSDPKAQAPESFEVRFNQGVYSLSAEEYAVWATAHGNPENVGKARPSRAIVERAAKVAGVRDFAPVFQQLIADGLLTVVPAQGPGRRAFAENHQIRPLALGLGNSASELGSFRIGMPNAPRATVGYEVYHMWLFCHQAANLWEAITSMASEAEEANRQEIESGRGDAVSLVSDPDVLLDGMLGALPVLISTSCVYVDRS